MEFENNGDVFKARSKACVFKDITNCHVEEVISKKLVTLKPLIDSENTFDLDTCAKKENRNVTVAPKTKDSKVASESKQPPAAECKTVAAASFKRSVDVMECDKADANNEIFAVQYSCDILANLKRDEDMRAPLGDYLALDDCLEKGIRASLFDLLIGVHYKLQMPDSTLYLCLNLVDRYLSKEAVSNSQLRDLGCACLSIASKYFCSDYDKSVSASDFKYLLGKRFCKDDLLDFEAEILVTLEFELTVATPLQFADRFTKMATFKLTTDDDKRFVQSMVRYCMELALCNYYLAVVSPSQLAAAALCYVLFTTHFVERRKEWDAYSHDFSEFGYSFERLLPSMKHLHELVLRNPSHTATARKYRSERHRNVAKFPFRKLKLSDIR